MNDLDPEVLRKIREAIARRRGYADYFSWPADRELEERMIAATLCEALDAAGQPLATSIASRERGEDPPDCEALGADGRPMAIEVTELVDPDAIKAVVSGATYDWAEWPVDKLIRRLRTGAQGTRRGFDKIAS